MVKRELNRRLRRLSTVADLALGQLELEVTHLNNPDSIRV